MGYDGDNPTYERLLAHTLRHGIRRWIKRALLKGARREDAQTIRACIKRMSDRELAKGLARMLAGKKR